MNDDTSSFDELNMSELSEEDLAVLNAFEAMDQWPTMLPLQETARESTKPAYPETFSPREDKEMLLIFIDEATADVTTIRQMLTQLEQNTPSKPTCFSTLRRASHKLHGTAGAVGFPLLSTLAAQIETISEEVLRDAISPRIGTQAVSAAAIALEYCLQTISSSGQEPEATSLLDSVEAAYQSLRIDLEQIKQARIAEQITRPIQFSAAQQTPTLPPASPPILETNTKPLPEMDEPVVTVQLSAEESQQGPATTLAPPPSIHVDMGRFERLIVRTEKLVEQRVAVEEAQTQVECALQELAIAQARLQRLEPLLASLQTRHQTPTSEQHAPIPSDSSLIARILNEAPADNQRQQQRHTQTGKMPASRPGTSLSQPHTAEHAQWDELELERYNEQEILQHTLKDAITDLTMTTANLQSAFTHFSIIQQDYLTSMSQIHKDTLLLRQVPFATLVPRLERVVKMSAPGQARQILFDVLGAETEIDQDILNTLATPLVQLLRVCLADPILLNGVTADTNPPSPHVWIKVHQQINRLYLEISFSMAIQGGAIETIRQPIQQLHGTISLQRNSTEGISFILRIPHPHSSVPCLQVRSGDQHLLVPINQINHINNEQHKQTELRYTLHEMLGFPATATSTELPAFNPVLVLATENEVTSEQSIGIAVDEIIGEQEYIIKPLSPYLQRPGIAGTTIDGKGRVLLLIDLLALVRSLPHNAVSRQNKDQAIIAPQRTTILVTDDSLALRRSLAQTLQQAGYIVFEAQDGVTALEQLQRHKPDICLLDVEMPNLNGYDVLQLMGNIPELASLKIIMLTSRSAVKHIQHALELGAHAYLTKPCAQDDLFQTIERLLHT